MEEHEETRKVLKEEIIKVIKNKSKYDNENSQENKKKRGPKLEIKEKTIKEVLGEEVKFLYNTQGSIRPIETFLANPLLSLVLPIINNILKESPINLPLLIETIILFNDYNYSVEFIISSLKVYQEDIKNNKDTFNYITSNDGRILIENLINILQIYNKNQQPKYWEKFNDFPLTYNINISELKWQELYINEKIYEFRLKKLNIPHTLCFSLEDCIFIYKSYYNKDTHPYRTLYNEICNKGKLDDIIYQIINDKKDTIIKELSIPPKTKGRPKGDKNLPFITNNANHQEQYLEELKKLCKNNSGKNIILIMAAAKDTEIFYDIPSFKAAELAFGNIGARSGYDKYKKNIIKEDIIYLNAKNALEKIKFKIEHN